MSPRTLYALWSIIVIVLAYIVPYTLLHSVRDFTLYLFWTLLAIIHFTVTIAYISKRWW